MSFVPTKFLKDQQIIEGYSSFFNVKMQTFSKLARIYIDCLNVSVLSAYCPLYCRYIIVPYTISNKRKLH